MPNRTCSVPGCDKPSRSLNQPLCPMHYHRLYRHGSIDRTAHHGVVTASGGRRYRRRYMPGHPLAGSDGKVYVHRMVLFDSIGPGLHACHWCQRPVFWTLPKGKPNQLQVDHLNGMGDDNDPSNLVPSCPRCNTTRASQARADALRAAGWWSRHDTVAVSGGRQERVA